MNLGVRSLMAKIETAAKAEGFHEVRVLFKVNAHGELVVACIIPPRTPHEWGPPKG
jgi:hypothetical protein